MDKLPVTNMADMHNLQAIPDKFSVIGISKNGNYAQK